MLFLATVTILPLLEINGVFETYVVIRKITVSEKIAGYLLTNIPRVFVVKFVIMCRIFRERFEEVNRLVETTSKNEVRVMEL